MNTWFSYSSGQDINKPEARKWTRSWNLQWDAFACNSVTPNWDWMNNLHRWQEGWTTLPQRIVIREFCKSREKGKLSLLHILYYSSWWLSSVEFRNVPGLDAVSVHVCIFIKTERKSGPKWWILIIMIITFLIIILKIDSWVFAVLGGKRKIRTETALI